MIGLLEIKPPTEYDFLDILLIVPSSLSSLHSSLGLVRSMISVGKSYPKAPLTPYPSPVVIKSLP